MSPTPETMILDSIYWTMTQQIKKNPNHFRKYCFWTSQNLENRNVQDMRVSQTKFTKNGSGACRQIPATRLINSCESWIWNHENTISSEWVFIICELYVQLKERNIFYCQLKERKQLESAFCFQLKELRYVHFQLKELKQFFIFN